MKKAILLILSLLVSVRALATPDIDLSSEPLRPQLVDEGDKLMQEGSSADDFLLKAREMRERQPFSAEEKSYLFDLGRKLPPQVREKVCPDLERGLCEGETSPLTASSLAQASPAQERLPMPPPPPMESSWSKPLLWVAAGALIFLAGSAALQGKEIQVRR